MKWMLLCWMLLVPWVRAADALPRAEDPLVEARLVVIAEELRCLVCQNESLASSHAELAEDLRREVRKLIRDNKSDAEIKTYLVERYGDFVLYRPQVKPLTWPLWFGPFFMLLLAIWGLWRYLRLRKNALAMQHATTADTAAHKD
ncbi:MAG: cytochrome c-type biogenesis protein [Limnohabitans sp.]